MTEEILFETASDLVSLLKQKKLKIATAESCTGGMVSEYITSVSGASEVFELGVCAYSAKMKNEILWVDPTTLEKFGTISSETASEMALGVRVKANADIGVSVTGVAGPNPSEGHPVGYVFIAVSTKEKTVAKLLNIKPISREYVRKTAVAELFKYIMEVIG